MAISTSDFSDHQKPALVQRSVMGGLSLQQACSQYGLSTDQLKQWVCLFRRFVRQALDHQLKDKLSLRGLDVELWRAKFSGDLADMGVPDLLRTIPLGRKDAHITITHVGEASEIWRLPTWLLVCSAVVCPSLGAMTVIALLDTAAFAPSSAQPIHGATPVPTASPFTSGVPELAAVSNVAAVAPAPRCPAPMVWMEGGSFRMGSDSRRLALSLAQPPHRVTLHGFCLDPHEVTASEYGACSDAGGCTPPHRTAHFAEPSEAGAPGLQNGSLCNGGKPGREQHPINCVSHGQAAEYCRARGGRLPTEAEWEFAARGADSRAFPWGNEKPTRSRVNACGKECERWHAEVGATKQPSSWNASDDGYAGTSPVGAFPRGKSPEGIDDLIGNVFEWTAAGLYEYEGAPSSDPRGPVDSDSFVIRGGNFNSALRDFLDPALRFAMHRESHSPGVGFRCAADAPPAAQTTATSLATAAPPAQTARPAFRR